MGKELRELVILHSNDIHGRFAGEKGDDGKLCHSLAQVAGYVSRAKKENPDTVYCIAGDVNLIVPKLIEKIKGVS